MIAVGDIIKAQHPGAMHSFYEQGTLFRYRVVRLYKHFVLCEKLDNAVHPYMECFGYHELGIVKPHPRFCDK